ncbi:hypothetical protein COOONC_17722 [Cooperia oncophora]
MKIRWVCSRWPGSAHDSRVFKTSAIYGQLQRRQLRGVLLGDSAYASETFLLKPDVNNPTERGKRRRYIEALARRALRRRAGLWSAEAAVFTYYMGNAAINAREPPDYDDYLGEDRQDGEVPSEPTDEPPDRLAYSFMQEVIRKYF